MVGYKRNYLHIWYLDLFQELQYLSLLFQYLFQVLQYLSTVQQQLGEIFLFICIKPEPWASLALNIWSVIQDNNLQICKLNLKRCSLFLSVIFIFFSFLDHILSQFWFSLSRPLFSPRPPDSAILLFCLQFDQKAWYLWLEIRVKQNIQNVQFEIQSNLCPDVSHQHYF